MVCCIYLLTNQDGYGYIGKTKNLKNRLYDHNGKANPTKSKLLGEHKECIILEECDEDCLDDFELYYFDMYKEMYGDKIVNRIRPKQTWDEWYKKNRETVINNTKEYNRANIENIKEYQKQYREANRKKAIEYQKANRENKREYDKRYRQQKRLKEIPNEKTA